MQDFLSWPKIRIFDSTLAGPKNRKRTLVPLVQCKISMSWPKIKFPIALLATQATHEYGIANIGAYSKLGLGVKYLLFSSVLCSYTVGNLLVSRVSCAVTEERMNLIKFADFLPPWVRGFFHILLTDFPRFTGAFFLSFGFPFIIKLFYYQIKIKINR